MKQQTLKLMIDEGIQRLEDMTTDKLKDGNIHKELNIISRLVLRYAIDYYNKANLLKYRNKLEKIMGINKEDEYRKTMIGY